MSVSRANHTIKKGKSIVFVPSNNASNNIIFPYFKRGDIVHSKRFQNIPIFEINLSAINMVNLHNT